MFYTHVSDQYSPFYTKVINTGVRDATHVLDGLLYHESDLEIEEHYTDSEGFTDQVFGTCHRLGFRFALRIRDLGDKRLHTIEKPSRYPKLISLIGGTIKTKDIASSWDEVLRLLSSIRLGTVNASLILSKLAKNLVHPQRGLCVMSYSGLHETSLLLLVLFRYIIWTTPKRAEDGFETSAALDGSIGIVPRPFWRL
jgi:TnpA family transposase